MRGSSPLVSPAGDKPPSTTSLRTDEVPCLFPRARIMLHLHPRARTSPLWRLRSVRMKSPVGFLVRGSGPLASPAKDKPPSVTPFGANKVPYLFPHARIRPRLFPRARTSPSTAPCRRSSCLFPCARIKPACSSAEDKPLRASAPCERSPLSVSSCEGQLCLFPRARTSPPWRLRLVRIESPACFLVRGQAPSDSV